MHCYKNVNRKLSEDKITKMPRQSMSKLKDYDLADRVSLIIISKLNNQDKTNLLNIDLSNRQGNIHKRISRWVKIHAFNNNHNSNNDNNNQKLKLKQQNRLRISIKNLYGQRTINSLTNKNSKILTNRLVMKLCKNKQKNLL